MKRGLPLFILSLLLSAQFGLAQSVGIVMSGGGAKGLYHIGMIKALEESGVPIDYVAGTSMGAIIAGLYASGYSTEEMEAIATSGELESWASGRIDDNLGSYFRKGSTLREGTSSFSYRFAPPSNKSDSLSTMPRSLISSTQVDMAMVNLFSTATTQCEGDFSRLMVPFLCVASDITDGCGVVFTKGDLGLVLRASMALPLAYKPIVDDRGHILYDGGIYDNFPWRPMIDEFNPDLIIGSACGVDSWSDTSNLSIFDQAFLLAMNPSEYDVPEEHGVTVRRNVPTGMLDFGSAEIVIQMGYEDTMAKIEEILSRIEHKSLKSDKYYSWRREHFKEGMPKLVFDQFDILGLDENYEKYLESFMTIRRRNLLFKRNKEELQDVNFDDLRLSIYTMLSSGGFLTDYPSVSYNRVRERYQFAMKVENKPPVEITLGGHISSTPFNQLYAGLSYKSVEQVAKELFAELYLGSLYTTGRMGYRADFFRQAPMFLDAYYTFSMRSLNHGNFGILTTVDNTLDTKTTSQSISIGVGAPIRKRSLMMFRTNFSTDNYNYEYGLPTDISNLNSLGVFYKTRFNYIASKLLAERNTIDNPYFPLQGSFISISGMGVVGGENSFSEDLSTIDDPTVTLVNTSRMTKSWVGSKIHAEQYFNLTPKKSLSLGITVEGVYTNIPEMATPSARQLMMPSYHPIDHTYMVYMPELSAPRYAAVGVIPNVRLWKELYFKSEFYAMMRDTFDETLRISEGGGFSMHYISQVSLVYCSPIGPASLSLTKYNVSDWNNLYLTFNFGYYIFAPKGTFY